MENTQSIFELGFLLMSASYIALTLIVPIAMYRHLLSTGRIDLKTMFVGVCAIAMFLLLGAYYIGSTTTKKEILNIYHSNEYSQEKMKDIALTYIRASANKQDSQKNQEDKTNNEFNEMLKALGITTEGGVK